MLTLCNHLLFYHGSLNANNDILFQQCNQTCAPSPSDSLINCDHLWITNTPPKWSDHKHTTKVVRIHHQSGLSQEQLVILMAITTRTIIWSQMPRWPFCHPSTMQSSQLSVQFLLNVYSWWDLLRGVHDRGLGYR